MLTSKYFLQLFYKKTCLLLTIIRLQLNLKSYINDDNNIDDEKNDSSYKSNGRRMSYHYYQHSLSVDDDVSVSISNLPLKQEFVRGNKVS